MLLFFITHLRNLRNGCYANAWFILGMTQNELKNLKGQLNLNKQTVPNQLRQFQNGGVSIYSLCQNDILFECSR